MISRNSNIVAPDWPSKDILGSQKSQFIILSYFLVKRNLNIVTLSKKFSTYL